MIENLPVLIVVIPLMTALLSPILSMIKKELIKVVMILSLIASFLMSCLLLKEVIAKGPIHYAMGNWQPPFGIDFLIDTLNGTLLVLIGAIGLLTAFYSTSFIKSMDKFKTGGYFSMLNLLITGLLGMVATGDVFNMYVFLEVASISAYTIIAMGGDKGVLSAFRYLLIGTVGAGFYLIGIAFLYAETGSLNMEDIGSIIGPIMGSGPIFLAMAFFIGGFGIKMALFPLHSWQPAAYTNSHPGGAPLIAGVMAKVPAYAMLRFFFFIFNPGNNYVHDMLIVVGLMSSAGIIYGSVQAIKQKDLRRMLAYSSIAQIGYIGIGLAVGSYYGLIGGVLHMIYHSIAKSGLFYCAGAIKYKYDIVNINKMGQIYKTMPKTVGAMVIFALSMIGVPPMGGFFSKWYLALGATHHGYYIYIFVIILSSLLNGIYFFRLMERIFMGENLVLETVHHEKKQDVPLSMELPIIISAILIIALGIFNGEIVNTLSNSIMGVVN